MPFVIKSDDPLRRAAVHPGDRMKKDRPEAMSRTTPWRPPEAARPTTGARPTAGVQRAAGVQPTAGIQPAGRSQPTAGSRPADDREQRRQVGCSTCNRVDAGGVRAWHAFRLVTALDAGDVFPGSPTWAGRRVEVRECPQCSRHIARATSRARDARAARLAGGPRPS